MGEMPLAHLASVAYFHSPKESPELSSVSGRLLPTPSRMMTSTKLGNATTPCGSRIRPSSISSIPRPSSGTSRRVTPLNRRASTPKSIEGNTKPGVSIGQQKSFLVNHGNPPSSFKLSKPGSRPSSPPSGRSRTSRRGSEDGICLPRSQHDKSKLSSSSVNPTWSSPKSFPAQADNSTASNTASNAFSSRKEHSTMRRLMRPLGPPVLSDLSLGRSLYGSNPSPESPVHNPLQKCRLLDEERNKIRFAGDLIQNPLDHLKKDEEGESMYEDPPEGKSDDLKIYQLKIRTDQGVCLPGLQTDTVSWPSTGDHNLNACVNSPDSKVSASQQQEKQSITLSKGRCDFDQSASINCQKPFLAPAGKSADSISTSPSVDEDWETNSRHVYFEESSAYWAGRYVALHDRARTEALNTDPQSFSISPRSSLSLEDSSGRSGFQLMSDILGKLRDCCMTRKALQSFEKFESVLQMNSSVQSASLPGSISSYSYRNTSRRESSTLTYPLVQQRFVERQTNPSGDPTQPVRRFNIPRLQAKSNTATGTDTIGKAGLMVNATNNIWGAQVEHSPQAFLCDEVRSKNIIEQQTVPVTNPQDPEDEFMNSSTNLDSPHTMKPVGHSRTYLHYELRPNLEAARSKSLEKGTMQTTRLHQGVDDSRKPSVGMKKTVVGDFDTTMQKARSTEHESNYSISLRHAPSYLEVWQLSRSPEAEDSFTDVKMAKKKGKSERQGSGEIMKNILGAGIREVRKMGKRVGSMSWNANDEDLISTLRTSGKQ